jgi:predicted nucleic acid-binding protein
LAVNPVVLGELEYGILLLPAGRRRTRLLRWLAEGIRRIRVLDFDADAASTWARLLADLKKKGLAIPVKDSQIAATALFHDLIVATRNTVGGLSKRGRTDRESFRGMKSRFVRHATCRDRSPRLPC